LPPVSAGLCKNFLAYHARKVQNLSAMYVANTSQSHQNCLCSTYHNKISWFGRLQDKIHAENGYIADYNVMAEADGSTVENQTGTSFSS
jgi:hypothetical protein